MSMSVSSIYVRVLFVNSFCSFSIFEQFRYVQAAYDYYPDLTFFTLRYVKVKYNLLTEFGFYNSNGVLAMQSNHIRGPFLL